MTNQNGAGRRRDLHRELSAERRQAREQRPTKPTEAELPPVAGESSGSTPPWVKPEEVGALLTARRQAEDKALLEELDLSRRLAQAGKRARQRVRRELPEGVDPHDLAQTGWGVIFPRGRKKKLRRYLEPLLGLREDRAGDLFRHFTYKNEPASAFLRHEGETIGTIHPDKVPYYLLIVGGPEEISFDFQYQLSLNHAVGRIHFSQLEDYTRYAQSVRDAETGKDLEVPRRTALFSVENDDTLKRLARHLVKPLRKSLENYVPGWDVEVWRKEQATKAHLLELLGQNSPGLLLVSCHGVRPEPFSKRQRERQGALMCHPTHEDDRDYVLTAGDVPNTSLSGRIVCLFACYGAGTPVLDNYPHEGRGEAAVLKTEPAVLTEHAFVAQLPQTLLSRGALAVLGHVDRGWTLSFAWGTRDRDGRPREIGAAGSLEDSLRRLLKSHRLGHALRPLHRRYAALAARLADTLDDQRIDVEPDLARLGVEWTAVNDARNFIVLGDPAVYLLGRRPEAGIDEETIRLRTVLLDDVRESACKQEMSVEEWVNDLVAKTVQGSSPESRSA